MRKCIAFLVAMICLSARAEELRVDPIFDITEVKPDSVVKQREFHGNSFIEFAQGKSKIDLNIGKNEKEIDSIFAIINKFAGNKYVVINNISIKGYASPEGLEDKNLELSKKRMKSLLDYISKNGNINYHSNIQVSGEGEDWELLDTLVNRGHSENKEAILSVIRDSTLSLDDKEDKIKTQFPHDYMVMARNIYPQLRRTYYKIDYTVSDMTDLKEIEQVYLTNPEFLSLYELYQLLGLYTKNSKRYYYILLAGGKYFPHCNIASINAGAAALTLGDYKKARMYLMRVKHLPYGLYNLGVLACYEGDYALALKYFRQLRSMPGAAYLADSVEHVVATIDAYLAEVKRIEEKRKEMEEAAEENGHKYVDLGLPSGTLWATCNVGAKDIYDPGDFLYWDGDVYKDALVALKEKRSEKQIAYHEFMCNALYEDMLEKGIIDENGVLGRKYDMVSKRWGGAWHMPTIGDFAELYANTTNKYVENGSQKGVWFTSKINGKAIYLPFGAPPGYGYPSNCCYWTSKLDKTGMMIVGRTKYARAFSAELSNNVWTNTVAVYLKADYDRNHTFKVRPVIRKTEIKYEEPAETIDVVVPKVDE